MPVITFANSKGGSGKTTSALLLACELATERPVTIIDADPRRPITKWATLPGKPERLTVISNKSEQTILDEIEEANAVSTFVIVDLEGTASRLMSYAISQSDLVIVPMKEQTQDATAAVDVVREIHRDMKAARRKIPYSILFTQSKVVAKSRTARFVANQFRENPDFHVFQTEIYDRDAFSALFSVGGTVRTLSKDTVRTTDEAVKNVQNYTHEVVLRLKDAMGIQNADAA